MAILHRTTLGNLQLLHVNASPNGSITAPQGSMALDSVNGNMWVNTDGATAWKNTADKAVTDAIIAENTDGEIPINVMAGFADGGTWTPTVSSAGKVLISRTVEIAINSWWMPIVVPNRTSASRGIKPTGLEVHYQLDGNTTDVTCEIWKTTMVAHQFSYTTAVLFGETDGDYDADHNTAAKRGDGVAGPEIHRASVTDAGTPVYLGLDEFLMFRFRMNGAASSSIHLEVAALKYSETLVDAA